MTASQYRAQTNAWNSHVKYSTQSKMALIGTATKEMYIALSDAAYLEYVNAGGLNLNLK